MKDIELWHGDCLELMRRIPDKSVDMVLCDLPYGVLNKTNPLSKWDAIIPLDELWSHYKRIVKEKGAIVLFGQGMFSAELMISNKAMWRYNLVWKKGNRTTGFLNAKRQPMRNHEDILIFSNGQTTYNPQMRTGFPVHSRGHNTTKAQNSCYGKYEVVETVKTTEKYPLSVIDIEKEHPSKYHPTQKPVELLEWLIKTYTNTGEVVLDNCMGSGSTGVAAKNLNRRFIGIEKEDKYFKISKQRIEE